MDTVGEPQSLLEWFAEKYQEFGAQLEVCLYCGRLVFLDYRFSFQIFVSIIQFVTNKSQEGAQFVKGFGGIGGLLRYKVDFTTIGGYEDDSDEFLSDDDDQYV
jgi:peptide chain release factor subunit 1